MSRSGGGGGGGGGPRSDCPLDCKVYVGELGKSGNREELEKAFGAFGKLRNVWVATNPPGFAFIMFEDARDAKYAVRDLDGRTICGRRVRVELSSGKTRYDGRGGDRGGGRDGRGGRDDHRDSERDNRYSPYERRGNGNASSGGYGGRSNNGPSPPPRDRRSGGGYDGRSSGGASAGANYERGGGRDYDTARSRTKRYSRSRSRSPVYRRDGNDVGYAGGASGGGRSGGRPRTPMSRSPSPKANSR